MRETVKHTILGSTRMYNLQCAGTTERSQCFQTAPWNLNNELRQDETEKSRHHRPMILPQDPQCHVDGLRAVMFDFGSVQHLAAFGLSFLQDFRRKPWWWGPRRGCHEWCVRVDSVLFTSCWQSQWLLRRCGSVCRGVCAGYYGEYGGAIKFPVNEDDNAHVHPRRWSPRLHEDPGSSHVKT